MLANHPALMNIHNTRWNTVGNTDDELHILTFDLIYCSIVYNFYEFQNYQKIIRKSKTDLEQEWIESEIESKRSELAELEKLLESEQKKLDEIPDINIEGYTVKHKLFGLGKVEKQTGTYIEVKFAQRTSKFIVTMAFIDGFLYSEDATVLDRCQRFESAIATCEKIEKAISTKRADIDALLAKLQ